MDEITFKKCCENYIKVYKDIVKEDFKTPPINDGYKYYIKSITRSDTSIKFKSIKRYYYTVDNKIKHKDSNKSFVIKLKKSVIDKLDESLDQWIFDNYLVIVAYISDYFLSKEEYKSQLEEYIY